MEDFTTKLAKLRQAIDQAQHHDVAGRVLDEEKSLYDYKERKLIYYKNSLETAIRDVYATGIQLSNQANLADQATIEFLSLLKRLQLNKENTASLLPLSDQLEKQASKLHLSRPIPKSRAERELVIKEPKLPGEIRDDLIADLQEVEKCFNAGCYRSAVILCGRVLETALHRKYYDVTGRDVLETQPGIGLGTLIAKLAEKNVQLDPGLTQQIHLINQVRVYSVHKKQSAFAPTKDQTHAMVLFTVDVVNKLFR
ncbi:DUF4145 domain-containing protein [Candidatus Woesearchaeota archaeon]|nr:DUF4145 domain-containing protein [Candidatus Woesearchaeota archaeon]